MTTPANATEATGTNRFGNAPDQTSPDPLPLRDEFVQNPHALYQQLHSRGPIHRVIIRGKLPVWLVTDFELARSLMLDPRLCKDNAKAMKLFPPGAAGSNATSLGANLLHLDGADHARLRSLVSKAFTARAVAKLRRSIEQRVDALLDSLPTDRPVDLIRSFAMPLPASVISMMLGVPAADGPQLAEWTTSFVSEATPEKLRDAEQSTINYLRGLIDAKRVNPGDDILSALIQAREAEDKLSSHELLATVFLLMLAGFETTVNLIGNGVHALLRAPEQMRLLRTKPELLPNAVEELLRLESPLNTATDRFTVEPITIGDMTIPAGEFVKIALLGANHDNAQFPDAERLDIERGGASTHLAFGHGVHYCLGAPLARLEGEIAFGHLLDKFPSITLAADDLTYRPSILIHGLAALPVRLSTTAQ